MKKDVAIIGGGPSGLYAAYYAGLRGLSTSLFEAASTWGGKLSAIYPDKPIYDVPGFKSVLARDLVQHLVEQTEQFPIDWRLQEAVLDLEKQENGWLIRTDRDRELLYSAVILATGGGAYQPRPHDCKNLMRFLHKGVYFVFKESIFSKDRPIWIVGGGDSAVDWFLTLHQKGYSVYLVHRRDEFRAHESQVVKLQQEYSEGLFLNTRIVEAWGNESLEGIRLVNPQQTWDVSCQSVLLCLGSLKSDIQFPSYSGSLKPQTIFKQIERGLYGIGEGFTQPDELHLIVTGFADAAQAVNHACHYLYPKEKIQPIYSTTLMKVRQRKKGSLSD